MTRACTSLKLVLATAALTLGLCGVALAGSTSISGNTVSFNGDPNEQNNILYGYDSASTNGPWVVIQEQNALYSNNAQPGCTNTNPNNSTTDVYTVWCPAGGISQLVLNGRDQNDGVNSPNFFGIGYNTGPGFAGPFFPPGMVVTASGGDGNDNLSLPAGTTVPGTGPTGSAFGDAGNDGITVFDGETGNGGDGDDSVGSGGPFAGEKTPFSGATLNGDAGNDALFASGAQTPDRLNGGDGDDGLNPGGGADDMAGGNGNDVAAWSGNNGVNVSLDNVANDGVPNQGANTHSDVENLLGNAPGNANNQSGGNGSDVLTGAPGVPNFIDGMGGNDTFNVASNPADPDIVICGDGFVTINADALDSFDSTGAAACRGRINKPPVASAVTLKIRSSSTKIDSDGQVGVKVGCRGVGACRGVLAVDKNGTVLGTATFVVPNGSTKRVAFTPRPAYAKRLKSGKSVTATATVDATDAGGATGTATSNITIHGKKKHKK